MYEMTNKIDFAYDGLDDAFPPIEPGVVPLGSRVLCQIRSPKRKTKGGIILTSDARETDQWNTQVAKVIATGPVAFKNRDDMKAWPEGAWVQAGDFVRIPKFGGDKWTVKIPAKTSLEEDQEILFVIFNDLDLIGKVEGDPLAMKAFI